MDLARVRVAVIGGGIGGLTAALALSRAGARVSVYERSVERKREGIALLIWTNAMRALHRVGIYEAVRAKAAPIRITEVRTPRGDVLAQLPIEQWASTPEFPTVAVRRPDIIATLEQALPDGTIQRGTRFESYVATQDRVIARLAGGTEHVFDVLIGADGIHSTVRAQLLGPSPPRRTNQHAWVGLARGAAALLTPGITTATVGDGPRFWSAPLEDGNAFWYATHHEPPLASFGVRELAARYADWHAPVSALFASTAAEDVVYAPIFDRPPADRWGTGRITLLGDAAHASTPDLGQGACQAIESAVALEAALSRASDLTSGLRAYEQLRIPRTTTISRLCWLTSLNSTARNPTLCALRNTVVRHGLAAIARGPLSWIMAGQEL